MLRTLILLFLIFFGVAKPFLQTIDKHSPSQLIDTTIALDWCDKAFELRYKSPVLATKYALSADSLSELLNYPKGRGEAKIVLGILSKNKQDYEQARTYYQEARQIREDIGDFNGVASCDNNLGNIDREEQKYQSAIKNYHRGINVLNKNQIKSRNLGSLFNNLAMIYNQLDEYQLAAQYIDSSLVIRTNLKDTLGMAYTLLNTGIIYHHHGFLENALDAFNQSHSLFQKKKRTNGLLKCLINIGVVNYEQGQYDLALNKFKKILKSIEKVSRFDQQIVYKNIGAIIQMTGGSIDSSLYYFNMALNIPNNTQSKKDIADLNYHIGRLYFQENDYKTSITHLEKSINFLDSIDAPFLKMNLLFKLSESYARINQFEKAFLYGNRSTLIQDSLSSIHKKAMDYKLNYEMVKKEKERREKEIKQQRIISGVFLISILMTCFIWFKNKLYRKAMQREIDDILRNQEIKTLQARIEGQDSERVRIGQDLHDRIGMLLSTIKLHFKSVEEKIDALRGEKIDQFQQATDLLDEACEEVRNIAHDMQTNTLIQFGLTEELKELADTLRATQKIEVHIVTFGMQERIDNQIEIKIYKIIQELIANILKHSNATNLNIQLNQFEELINLMVEDNGKGFIPKELKSYDGMGLKNIRTRVLDLHGTINIDSEPGRGTVVSIDVPLSKKRELL